MRSALAASVEESFDGPEGLDLPAARAELSQRRNTLVREQTRVTKMLHTFQHVARTYKTASAA